MKTSWDVYLERQLRKPKVKKAFAEEKRVLNIGMVLARQRNRKGLTQEEVGPADWHQRASGQQDRT